MKKQKRCSNGSASPLPDGTNRPIAEELVAAGIPREDIVLGFHPAELRQLTGYGVA